MVASKIGAEVLERAARDVGVRVEINSLSATRHRVKVLPDVPSRCYTPAGHRRKGDAGDAPYQRESVGYGSAGRRVHAVCWHGFRDFFRAAFEHTPDAIFRTALDTWRGAQDFEARYAFSGTKNIGAPSAPTHFAEACRCPESGYAG